MFISGSLFSTNGRTWGTIYQVRVGKVEWSRQKKQLYPIVGITHGNYVQIDRDKFNSLSWAWVRFFGTKQVLKTGPFGLTSHPFFEGVG